MNSLASVFFAYEGGHQQNIDCINAGIAEFNKHQASYHALTWQELNVTGNILNAAVLLAIDRCDVFACDLTYLNHNVLFELGYAIGKGKELLVLINPSVSGAKESYIDSRFVKNIGFAEFTTGKDVLKALQQHHFEHEVSITALIDARTQEIDTADLLYLESPVQSQASLDLKAYLTSADGQIIVNDTVEVEYQTLSWYVASLVKSRAVIVHLLGSDTVDRDLHNGEYSFYAGVAAGLGKKVLLIAPKPFRAPIDYSDILIEYESSYDCVAKTAGWYSARRQESADNFRLESTPPSVDRDSNLLYLGIGYEMAEEESDLLSYFVEIETYRAALTRNTSIVTGRKGAGKTALFLKLSDEFQSKTSNSFTVVLRPESDELLSDVELTRLYDSTASRQAFLTSVWRYVILSRLITHVADRIRGLPSFDVQIDSLPTQITQFVDDNEMLLRDGHFSFISRLYRDLDAAGGLGNQRALEDLYRRYIAPTQDLLRQYFSSHKYAEINVLADNLDKTWDADNGLDLQSDMILSLLSFNTRIPSEIDCSTLKPHTVVFLRNDIFEYVLDRAREPDKLIARKIEVDWHRFPEKLRELIEQRFRHSLGRSESSSVDDVWTDYFKFTKREHPFDALRSVLVSRPRDFIFMLSKMFESAINRGTAEVDNRDFEYALEAYSNYLYRNMIAETRARFPAIVGILKDVQKSTQTGAMDYREFSKLLLQNGLPEPKASELMEFLYDKDYIFAFHTNGGRIVKSFQEFLSLRDEKRMFFFRRHRLSVQIHPNRSRLVGRLRSAGT